MLALLAASLRRAVALKSEGEGSEHGMVEEGLDFDFASEKYALALRAEQGATYQPTVRHLRDGLSSICARRHGCNESLTSPLHERR